MVTQLETVELLGKKWYIDERLKQFRNVDNPNEFLSFDEMDAKMDAQE